MTLVLDPIAQTSEKVRVCVHVLDSARAGVTGATVLLSLRRNTDGFFYTGTVFQSAFATMTMTATDAANWPGVYHYDFTTPVLQCILTAHVTTAAATATNDPWLGQIKVGYWANNVDEAISSRASADDATEMLKRFGGSIMDIEFRRIISRLEQMKSK